MPNDSKEWQFTLMNLGEYLSSYGFKTKLIFRDMREIVESLGKSYKSPEQTILSHIKKWREKHKSRYKGNKIPDRRNLNYNVYKEKDEFEETCCLVWSSRHILMKWRDSNLKSRSFKSYV